MIIPTLAAAEKWINRAKTTLEAEVCANSSTSGPGLVFFEAVVGHWQTVRYRRCYLRRLVLASATPAPTTKTQHPLASREREKIASDSSAPATKGKGDPSVIFGQSIHPRHDCLTAMAGQPRILGSPPLPVPAVLQSIRRRRASRLCQCCLGPRHRRLGVWPLASLSLGRATLQSTVSRGHPSREVIKVPVLVRSKLTVSLYWAPWAETSLALYYSSGPSNPLACRRNHHT